MLRVKILGLTGSMALVAAVFLPAGRQFLVNPMSFSFDPRVPATKAPCSLRQYAIPDVEAVVTSQIPPVRPDALDDDARRIAKALFPMGARGECAVLGLFALAGAVLCAMGWFRWLLVVACTLTGWALIVASRYYRTVSGWRLNAVSPGDDFYPWAWFAMGTAVLLFGTAAILAIRAEGRDTAEMAAFD